MTSVILSTLRKSGILNVDKRNRYVLGSFFDLATDPSIGFDPNHAGKKFDTILLDIDHSPTEFLNPSNADFYTTENLARMAEQLKPNGVFAMWSRSLTQNKHQKTTLLNCLKLSSQASIPT